MVPRWWRNRVERPLSTQQIHQKIICVQSNPHRTTSECWWRIQMPSKANQSSQYEVWCVLVTQSCLTLCIPMDCSPLGSSVLGISQARILGEQPFLSLGNLPDPGIEPRSPTLQENSLPSEPLRKPWNEVGQMINMKKETKDLGLGNCLEEGVMMEDNFSHNRKPSHRLDQWGAQEPQREV